MAHKNARIIYSLVSAGFSLAIILLFGVVLLNPIETSLFWGVSALGTINITFYLTIILVYIIYLLFPFLSSRIKQISDFLLLLSLLATLIIAINTTYNSQEGWFLALNYFVKNFGYTIGFVLGFSSSSLIGSIQTLSLDQNHDATNKNYLHPLIILISFFLFTILFMGLWRYSSIFALLIMLFSLSSLGVLTMTILISLKPKAVNLKANIIKNEQIPKSYKIFTRQNILPFSFASFFFLLFAGIGIYGIIDKNEILFFPGAPIPGTVRTFQIATVLAATLFVIAVIVLVSFELKKKPEKTDLKSAKTITRNLFNPVIRIFKSLFEMLGIIVGVYYFCIVIYLPIAFINIAIFGILGTLIYCGVHLLASKLISKNYSALVDKLLYSLGVLLFVICMFLLLNDNVTNGLQYDKYTNSMSNEWFPFKFILSSGHFFTMGLSLGLIISYNFKQRFFNDKKFNPSSGRVVGLILAFFLTGLMTVGFTHAITLLKGAGDWPPTYNMKISNIPFGEFFTTLFTCCFALAYVLEILSDIESFKPKQKVHIPLVSPATADQYVFLQPQVRHTTTFKNRILTTFNKRIFVSIIIFAVLLSSTVYLGFSFESSLERDLLASSSDFYIWTTDSYEKIMPSSYIPTNAYKSVDYAEIDVSKNEYGSLQIIWYAKQNSTLLNARIVSALSDDGSSLSELNIRYAAPLYDQSYPEVLQPVINTPLTKGNHTSFWFDFFSTENQNPGTYRAIIDFTYKNNKGATNSIEVNISVNVASYGLPSSSHYYYNLPWGETPYTESFYSHKRQFLNGAEIVEPLINNSWYDETSKTWDYTKPLSDSVKENVYKNWNVTVETGMDLWYAWIDLAIKSLDYGRPLIRLDYLTYIARNDSGIGNPTNWKGEKWTGNAWFESEREKLYSYYYFINDLLLSIDVNDETLADWVIVKWKDEWDQPQFFPSSPSGRLLERSELYKIYELEISEMVRAGKDAATAAGAARGIRLLANVNPVAANMDILFDYFDIYCPLSYAISDSLVQYCHENGKNVWLYTCVQPFAPYANQFAYNQLYETHITQWQVYTTRTEGYWLWRSDYKNHSNYFYGFNGYLDGIFIYYPDGNKPAEINENSFYTGIRFETATESIEEVELFIMLENILLSLKSSDVNNITKYNQILKDFNSKLRNLVKSMSEFTHDINEMRSFIKWTRETIAELYKDFFIDQEELFYEIINSKWNTFNNPFNF
ncbi:MAG: hypothetical protein LBF12_06970 [Christensenellaceae bacterium]|jgi:hypothetical protein|nr:hypothetical protein [Christensenellaceae bacterium]